MLNLISPARTPSKSSNVERLMSLQKSSRHISDADILSFAAEASAMKRMAKSTTDENSNPNSRSVSKRLFDINQCTKSVLGSYSPEGPAETTLQQQQDAEQSEESDSETDEVDTEQQTEKHVEQILQLVQHSASKAMRKREAKRAAARQNTTAGTTSAGNSITANSHSSTANSNSTVYTEHDEGFDDAFGGSSAMEMDSSDVQMQEPNTSAATATTSTVVVPVVTTAGGIRDLVIAHILSILNHGTYEEILSLHGIGQVRALRIQTVRNAGHTFASLQNLQEVGMNDWSIAKFLKSNAAHIVS